jgi:hypothetical protein
MFRAADKLLRTEKYVFSCRQAAEYGKYVLSCRKAAEYRKYV